MRLLVASHKLCWSDPAAASGYATDGGFAVQIGALAGLFDETIVCVPVAEAEAPTGLTPLPSDLTVRPLRHPGAGPLRRRATVLAWIGPLIRGLRDADAVHAPVPGDVGFLTVVLALLARKPLFVRHCATWREPRTRADRLLRRLLERTAGGRNVVLATGGDAAPPSPDVASIEWIFSSSIRDADLDAVRQRPARRAPAAGSARLVTGGRLIVDKGADTVLEAFAVLHERGLVAHLDIVGDGPARAALETAARSLGCADIVSFRGRLARVDVLEVFDDADLFVYPTRSSEGFPKLVLEALSRGLPVVATPVSAIPVLVGDAGVIVAPGPDEVVAAAAALLEDGVRYEAAQRATLERASHFTLEAWVAAIGARLTEAWGPLRATPVPVGST